MMIYTIGRTVNYERMFQQFSPVQKLGRTNTYPGGSVWPTPEKAREHAPPGYSVYGVVADWDRDTTPSADGPWNDLLVTSDLVRLD